MAFKTFAILAMLCIGASAQGNLKDIVGNSLEQKHTELDCLLGKPNCPSPPPPTQSPPPPTASPPPPASSPPPPSTPPPPAAGGTAQLIIGVNKVGAPLTDAQKAVLAGLIGRSIGATATVRPTVIPGRKLLAEETIDFDLSEIADCPTAERELLDYINGPDFRADAAAEGINLSDSQVLYFSCSGAGDPVVYRALLPPLPAPAPAPTTAPDAIARAIFGLYNQGAGDLTDAQKNAIAQALADAMGPGVTGVAEDLNGRRHLLAGGETLSITFEKIPNCATAFQNLQAAIADGSIESKLAAQNIFVSNIEIGSFACVDPSQPGSSTSYVNPTFSSPPSAESPIGGATGAQG